MATETKRTMVRNTEAVTMDKIASLLEGLDAEARKRVLTWVNAVYLPTEEPAK